MKQWEAPALRNGFDYRGHQCDACGMHHCHMQVPPSGKHKGQIVDEPEYEGWSGAGWTIGCTDPVAVSWLNTQLDRACVDVDEFGWLCGWVMECQERRYITEKQLGFRLAWGDAEGANRLVQMISRREGLGDLLAEGTKLAAERLGGGAAECAIYTGKNASPRGHDHRGRWEEMLDTCTGSTGTLETGPAVFPAELGLPAPSTRSTPSRSRARSPGSMGVGTSRTRSARASSPRERIREPHPHPVGGDRLGLLPRRGHALRPADRRDLPRLQPPVRRLGNELERPSRRYGSTPVDGPAKGQSIEKHWERMLDVWYEGHGVRPPERAAHPRDAPRRRPGIDDPGRVGGDGPAGEGGAGPAARGPRRGPVLGEPARRRAGYGPGDGGWRVVPQGSTVRDVLRVMSERFPSSARRSGPTRPRELGDNIEILVNNGVLGLTHDLDSEVLDGERLMLLGEYMGGGPELGRRRLRRRFTEGPRDRAEMFSAGSVRRGGPGAPPHPGARGALHRHPERGAGAPGWAGLGALAPRGHAVHVAAAALGLSALLVSSALAFDVVKYLGALYLVYLGVRKLAGWDRPAGGRAAEPRSLRRLFGQGVVVNVLNPKTALFFLAFLPQFVDVSRGAVGSQILALGLIFVALGVVSDGLYAVAAGTAGAWLKRDGRFLRARAVRQRKHLRRPRRDRGPRRQRPEVGLPPPAGAGLRGNHDPEAHAASANVLPCAT